MRVEDFLIRQARLAGEAAFRTLHPPEPFVAGDSHVVGAELYRQAIHWALAAHEALRSKAESGHESPIPNEEAQPLSSLETLLTTTPPSALETWAKDSAHLERCLRHLRTDNYGVYALLSEVEQQKLCDDLADFYRALVLPLEPTQRAAEKAAFKRNLKLLAASLALLAVSVGVWQGLRWYKLRGDLALDATWSASSIYNPALQCKSPDQECKEGKDFFFCTRQEKNPWFILDLKQTKKFSSVELVNRQDCCGERANPLTISVSKDGKTWQTVAERKAEFKTLNTTFPKVSARYIKLEIPKSDGILHLRRVRVFP
jgi:hypothetical protein